MGPARAPPTLKIFPLNQSASFFPSEARPQMGPWVRHASALKRLLKGALRAPRVNTDLWGPDRHQDWHRLRALAHSEGGRRFSASELIVVGQVAHARRRPALRQARPVRSLLRDRSASVDAGPPTSVDEPAVVGGQPNPGGCAGGEHQLSAGARFAYE